MACLSAECDRRALDTDDGDGDDEEEEEEALSRLPLHSLPRSPPFPPRFFPASPHSIRTVEAGYGALPLPPNDLGLPGSMEEEEEEEVPTATAAAVGDESARGPCLHCLVRAWIGLLARPTRCSFPLVLYCTEYRERNEAPPPFLLPCYCICPMRRRSGSLNSQRKRGSSIHPRGAQIGRGVCL